MSTIDIMQNKYCTFYYVTTYSDLCLKLENLKILLEGKNGKGKEKIINSIQIQKSIIKNVDEVVAVCSMSTL